MIIIQPSGGLCNRMRVINSAYILAQKKHCKLVVLWKMCDELNCPFEELFLPPKELVIYNFKSNYNLKKLFYQLTSKQKYQNSDIEANKTDGVLHENFLNSLGTSVYISTWEHFYPAKDYHLFVPTQSLAQKVDTIVKELGSHGVGVHIRRTDNTWAIANSKSDDFSQAIRQELQQFPEAKFYLATDDAKEEERLKQEFGSAIVTNTGKTLARDSIQGMHDALIDLFCLSKTTKIFGSFYSSFTDIAADMNHIEKIVVGKQDSV